MPRQSQLPLTRRHLVLFYSALLSPLSSTAAVFALAALMVSVSRFEALAGGIWAPFAQAAIAPTSSCSDGGPSSISRSLTRALSSCLIADDAETGAAQREPSNPFLLSTRVPSASAGNQIIRRPRLAIEISQPSQPEMH